ncbi:hypothetical protein CPB84DRAFT_1406230 [Gymnopilus junonius]|uniref:Uncharacterized protein n=1 Tax=Gymnopilus junonius TaxID=109634 RepID=A0A9P5NIF7_GYMJU|nr:hypothetical protein CPB84DRAFT_1406230 [Gymnopilus junonius]
MTTDGRPRYTRQSSSPAIAAMSSRHNAPNQVQSHWPTRVASVESLQFTALPSAHPTASASTSNLLKKRHSSYALSSAATPMTMDRTVSLPVPPLPDLPLPLASRVPMPAHQQPSRPPRNPARIPAPLSLYSTSQTSLVSTGANGITIVQSASIHPPLPYRRSKVNKGSRPSTAESTSTNASASISIRERSAISQDRQDITPWEFQSLREEKVSFEGEKHAVRTPLSATATSPTAASLKSRASSVGTSTTGPIEEVTPWELYPIPPSPRQYQQPAGAGKGAPSITSRSSSSSNSNSKKSREARSNSTSNNSLSNINSLPTPTPYALGFASASSSHLSYVSSSPYPSAPPSASSGAGFNVGPSTPLSSQAPTQKERTFLPHSPSTSTLGSATSSNFNLRLHHSQSHPNPTHSSHPHPHPLIPYTPIHRTHRSKWSLLPSARARVQWRM